MNAMVAGLRGLPLPARYAVVAAVTGGVIGAIIGLIIGLHVHAATALFALVELGFPAAVVGAIAGLIAGTIVTLWRRLKTRDTHSP